MINPAPYLRKKIFALLNGNITYNALPVPVFEGQGKDLQNQVIIMGYSDNGVPNKHCFIKNASQDVEIITVKNDPTSKDSDAIAELVMNLIHPTVESDLLSGTEFTVDVAAAPSLLPIREDSIEGTTIVRRVLRYSLLISENN